MPRDGMPPPNPNPPVPAPAPPSPPVPPPAAPPAAPQDPAKLAEEVEALKRHNKKLIEEKKQTADRLVKLEGRFTDLAKSFGADPKEDPAAMQAKREAEERAKADKKSRIDRGVLMEIVASGKSVPKDVAEYLSWKAQNAETVTIDEQGAVVGLTEFIESALKNGLSGGFTPPPPTPPPAKPAAGATPPDPVWEKLKKWSDFLALPPLDQVSLRQKNPDQVAALKQKR